MENKEPKTLNTQILSNVIIEKRGDRSMREVLSEIRGVSLSTYSRIERGHVPDVNTFINLCVWVDKPMELFIGDKPKCLFLDENI